ncbi:Pycsar system effector family protein [Streptomyces macrosporus]|uniref:Pycsar effector protein domain-containing protein n=1 Tax=Streptomyces macrosporus TaxID=44032 RepID=A0ABN3K4M7_9ACTN
MASAAPAPRPSAGSPGDGAHIVAERLLASVREEIGRADTKASILLSGSLAVLLLFSGRTGEPADRPAARVALTLVGGLLWMAGIAMFVAVVLPRTRVTGRAAGDGEAALFPDLARGATVEELLPRIAAAGLDTVRWSTGQACELGHILASKYRWLRVGVGCLVAGGVVALAGNLW